MTSTERRAAGWIYRAMFIGAAAVAAVAMVFFVAGLSDGSVSAFNIGLWLGLLGGVGAVLGGGAWLGAHGRPGPAAALLALLALPAMGYALFIILVIASGARWN